MRDKALEEDLKAICSDPAVPVDKLAGRKILVTGATGLIGSNLVKLLLTINRKKKQHGKILALVRNREKSEKIYAEWLNDENLCLIQGDIRENWSDFFSDMTPEFIFHTASVTASKYMVDYPVETIDTIVNGTSQMLRFAKEVQCKGVVFLSSMEVYGTSDLPEVREENIGYVNPLSVRSDYPESKKLCENLCVAYSREYGIPVKIARLAQVFGAGVLPGESRVFAQFARSVINGTDIILHTQGRSEGNYCYLGDALSALLILMIRGKSGEAYNIANEENHTTIAAMAEIVAKQIAGGKIRVVYDIPDINQNGYAPDVKLKLNADKMRSLGWKPKVNLRESYERMIISMQAAC